jgi:cytochrome c-type biogenesis protein CcmH
MRAAAVLLVWALLLGAAGAVGGPAGMLLVGSAALAAPTPDEVLEDPDLEARARALAKELRCLVCQNQSIDDSDADLARDLRQIVRERLVAGDSDEEIIDFVTARYGDFVLLRPPVKPATWGLWYGPLGIFVIAGIAVAFYLRGRRDEGEGQEPEQLSADEQAKLDRLLERRTTNQT